MNIGIYIYDNAEVLDFSGPFEVFSTAKRLSFSDWNIFFVAENKRTIHARGNFMIIPHYSFDDHPKIDILIVPGGVHNNEIKKNIVINWISNTSDSAQKIASVCTGAFLVAEASLPDNLKVTTHWEDINDLKKDYPNLKILENKRWVSSGKFISSAGISAGIDMSLFLVSELCSMELANKTANQMEYNWQKNSKCR